MNKEQLQQDIDAMREKLAEMEAKLKEKEKVKKYFIPEVGERYWFVEGLGDAYLEINDGGSIHSQRIAVGNCYETPAEVEKADAKQKAYIRIVRALRDHEEEGYERESIIYYSNDVNGYAISLCSPYTLIVFDSRNKELFSTYDACNWVIDNMKDDLNLYFGE